LKVWIGAFVDIYKNCYQGRGSMLLPVILFIIASFVYGTFTIFTSYQGFWAWFLFVAMLYAWLLAFPSAIYLIDRKKKSSKLSEIRVVKDSGCDGFS